jgi:hypothetical protein
MGRVKDGGVGKRDTKSLMLGGLPCVKGRDQGGRAVPAGGLCGWVQQHNQGAQR